MEWQEQLKTSLLLYEWIHGEGSWNRTLPSFNVYQMPSSFREVYDFIEKDKKYFGMFCEKLTRKCNDIEIYLHITSVLTKLLLNPDNKPFIIDVMADIAIMDKQPQKEYIVMDYSGGYQIITTNNIDYHMKNQLSIFGRWNAIYKEDGVWYYIDSYGKSGLHEERING